MHTNSSPPSSLRPEEDRSSQENLSTEHDASRSSVVRPPILASEVLREELAPIEPGRITLRLWLTGMSACMAAIGVLIWFGYLPDSSEAACLALGAAGLTLLATLVPYALRGVLVSVAGLTVIVFGLLGRGPLHALVPAHKEVFTGLARVLAATCLPAALLFRARYRAYRGARIALVFGLLLAAPAVAHAGLVIASGPSIARVTSALVVLSVLTSLLGFMGSGTTGASTAWAIAVVVTIGIDLSLPVLWPTPALKPHLSQVETGIVFVVSCALTAIGLFKILASVLAGDARRVDVLGQEPAAEQPSDGSDGSD